MSKDVSLNNLRPVGGVAEQNRSVNSRDNTDPALFKQALRDVAGELTQRAPQNGPGTLKFSNHAVDRMQSRGIRFSPEEMAKIENAAAKASAKGAKECLLISDQAALIVSLKDKTVVTVMDKANLKENVFTNIDATVMI
jgi:flagellar operon protein